MLHFLVAVYLANLLSCENTCDRSYLCISHRVENTHKGAQTIYHTDLNALFWSDEEATVDFSYVCGKCTVVYRENVAEDIDSYFLGGFDRFCFSESYNADTRQFEDPPAKARLMGSKGKVGKIFF